MGPFRPDRKVFRRGDNVLGYWVDHAEGFEVRSGARVRARVDAIVVDPERGRAKALVVRSRRLHRRRLIPVEAVLAVDPFARRLEVERARRRSVSRASRSLTQLVVAVVTGVGRLFTWLIPRLRQVTILAYIGARRLTRLAAAAGAWLVPRVQTVAVACWALGSGLALRFGGALATRAKSIAAWLGPRLSAGTSSAWTHTATAVAQLGPRLSNLARTALMQAVGVGGLCVLGVVAATAWITPRLRASVEAVAWATVISGVAVAEAVYLVGTRLSRHVRYVSPLRRN